MKILASIVLAFHIIAVAAGPPECKTEDAKNWPDTKTYNDQAVTVCRNLFKGLLGPSNEDVDKLYQINYLYQRWYTTLKTTTGKTRNMVFEIGTPTDQHTKATITLTQCINGFTKRTNDVTNGQWKPCWLGKKDNLLVRDWHSKLKREGYKTVEFHVFPEMELSTVDPFKNNR